MSTLLKGKKGILMGLANKRSIAYGIAKQISNEGGQIILTYQNDILLKRIKPIAEDLNIKHIIKCDVAKQGDVEQSFALIKEKVGNIDFLVHSIAFAKKQDLEGNFLDTTADNFSLCLNVSCFSFMAACREAAKFMNPNASILTLSYLGAQRIVPNYNLMGVAKAALEAAVKYASLELGNKNIRVNAISAGPIKTLAASGINNFSAMLRLGELSSPLKNKITIDDVGKAAIYLLSHLSSSVTSEIHYVDAGYNAMGMINPKHAKEIAKLLDESNF